LRENGLIEQGSDSIVLAKELEHLPFGIDSHCMNIISWSLLIISH
jgi:hypothetical protein